MYDNVGKKNNEQEPKYEVYKVQYFFGNNDGPGLVSEV